MCRLWKRRRNSKDVQLVAELDAEASEATLREARLVREMKRAEEAESRAVREKARMLGQQIIEELNRSSRAEEGTA